MSEGIPIGDLFRSSLLNMAELYGKQKRAEVEAMTPEERRAWAREVLGEEAYQRIVAEVRDMMALEGGADEQD